MITMMISAKYMQRLPNRLSFDFENCIRPGLGFGLGLEKLSSFNITACSHTLMYNTAKPAERPSIHSGR